MYPHESQIRTATILARRAMLLLLVVGAVLLASTGVVLSEEAAPRAAEPDRYIVVLKDYTGQQAPEQVVSEHARRYGLHVRHVYQNAIKGYAAVIPNERVAAVRNDDRVAYLEPDKEVGVASQVLPWGINRIDADNSSTRAGDGSGTTTNVNAYIIDTGVDATHPDLKVVKHVNFVGGANADCNGHGTHVAGTVAAKDNTSHVVGVAPGAPLTGVKVLGCDGSGWTSDVIEGVDWVTANATKPAIANMSLGSGPSYSLDSAVQNSAKSGVFYAVAAGNEGADACTNSPARAGAGGSTNNGLLGSGILSAGAAENGILTVAATDRYEAEASWSNYGKCVELWAPGVSVRSTHLGGGTTTMSGTSMAAPHVGGAAALYLSKNTGVSAAGVETQLKADSVAWGTKSKDDSMIKRLFAGRY